LAGKIVPLPGYLKRIGNSDIGHGEKVGSYNVWPTANPVLTVEPGERFSFSLRIRPVTGELNLAASTAEPISCKLRREAGGAGYWLDVDVAPVTEPGSHARAIGLFEEGKETTPFSVNLTVTLPSENLIVTPRSIEVSELALSKLKSGTLRLGRVGIRKQAGAFKVVSVSTTLEFVRAEVETIVHGSNYVVRLTGDPSNAPRLGLHEGMLRITTDDTTVPPLEVPLKITVVDR
jgi:hypothetical protein